MKFLLLPIFLMVFLDANCQDNYRYPAHEDMHHTSDVSGGNASGQGGSISYSVGQVFFTVNHSYEFVVLEGVQQPSSQTETTSINEINDFTITAYPNPFTDVLYINIDDFENKDLRYLIFDIQGNLLKRIRVKERTTEVFLYNLQAAAYLLKIFNGDVNVTTLKLIKK